MTHNPTVVISFKDVDIQETVRENLETRLEALAREFPETTRFEVTLSPDGVGHAAHGRVTGKNTEVATHATADDLSVAAEQLVDKIEKQLRRLHDKRIFVQRRGAQKHPPKKNSS